MAGRENESNGGNGLEMYQLLREIPVVAGAASGFHNNLSVWRTENKALTYAAFAPTKHQVNTMSWDVKMEGMTNDTYPSTDPTGAGTANASTRTFAVIQVKFVTIPDRQLPFLVVCTSGGVMVMDHNGSSLLSWYPVHRSENEENFCYTKGIATLEHYICAGSHKGHIVVMSGRENAVKQKAVLKEHRSAVVDLASDESSLLASVSIDGVVFCWERAVPSGLKILNKISTGVLGVYEGMVFCGTVLGQILVYTAQQGELIIEIAAHARIITSLAFALENGLLLSTSEDSFVRVWKVKLKSKESDSCEVICAFSKNIENVMAVGGDWVDQKGGSFCVTGFDLPIIYYFKYNKLDRSYSRLETIASISRDTGMF